MPANLALVEQTLQPLLALFGLAYVLVPLVEWKRRIVLRESVLFRRVLSWTFIALVYLIALAGGVPLIALLFALLARQATAEYAALARLTPSYAVLLRESAAPAIMLTALWPAASGALPFLFLLALSLDALRAQRIDGVLMESAHALLGFVWIVWTLAHAVLLAHAPDGTAWLLIISLSVACSDTAAGVLGMLFGRRKLAPVISPGKTWAGAVGNFAGAALGFALAALVMRILPSSTPLLAALLIAWVAVGSLWGDLIESLFKRTSGVKDAGTLLPGFGGLLDRIDSLLVVLPFAYYLVRA